MVLRVSIVVAAVLVGIAACGESPPMTMVCGQMVTSNPILNSQCGPTLEFTPINTYQGELAAVVQDREDAVVLINGNCTGTLIAANAGPIVLTAGHCVAPGERSLLAFNVETDPDGDPLVTNGTVIEQSTEPDYALIKLDKLPAITPTLLATQPGDRLVIIQHPRGAPKVVAEGDFLAECDGLIYYADLDTLVGSSGAGVINRDGRLVGVHTDGDCAVNGSGTNRGWTTARIVEASPYLLDADIHDL